jgi:hypothetical protein
MSHLRCPLCGKNAPLSTFNPSELDSDLTVASFSGLGRARGFAKVDEYSVLGDDELSPIVADRALALCKMFLDAGTLTPESIIDGLGLKPTAKSKELPSQPPPKVIYVRSRSRDAELERALKTIEEQEKEITIKEMIDTVLHKFIKYYPFVQINEDEDPWTITINYYDEECFKKLYVLYRPLKLDMQKRLRKRLKTINPSVKVLLERFTEKPKKTLSEISLEIDPRWVLADFNLESKAPPSERPTADDNVIPTSADTKKREKTLSEQMLEYE